MATFQGDEALGGALTVAGVFTAPIIRLSLEAAPAFQGTAEYTLTAFDRAGQVVDSRAVVVTEDEGDPAHQGFGYFTVDPGTLPRPGDIVYVPKSLPPKLFWDPRLRRGAR